MSTEHNEIEDVSARLVNVISLLLPARGYKLQCSWTTEKPLPAIEEFSCRLLLLFESLPTSAIQSYFGLSNREREVLLENLQRKKLIEISVEGNVQASPMLKVKARGDTQAVPTLTTYEDRQETAFFDLLTHHLLPRKSYEGIKYGLPEIPAEDISDESEIISDAFSRQYKSHLENTRSRSDAQRTRLYKIDICRRDKLVQVPIDMDISIEPSLDDEPRVIRDVSEKIDGIRQRSLPNELESKIADYLANAPNMDVGLSMQEFCELVSDDVLIKYSNGYYFDFNRWLEDRKNRRTGYGTPATTAILGPVYLKSNRITLSRRLQQVFKDNTDSAFDKAYWLPSSVPLWASNGTDLSRFINDFQQSLSQGDGSKGSLITIFPVNGTQDRKLWIKKFKARLPHAASLIDGRALDRMEILLVPGAMAVAQYHIQPSKSSSVTFPIGFLTTDPYRVEEITKILADRITTARGTDNLWTQNKRDHTNLLDFAFLNNSSTDKLNNDSTPPTIRYKKPQRKVDGE